MRITVKCDHSGLREVDVDPDPNATAAGVGELVREVMLACPACAVKADAFLPRVSFVKPDEARA